MAHFHIPSEIPVRYLDRSRGFTMLAGAMFVVGLVAFFALRAADADRAWHAYVGNWLFFLAVAQGAVMLAVVTTIVRAKWNWSVRRVSLAFVAYLPIAFVLFVPMLGLRESYFPWIELMATDPIVQEKAAWLNIPFLVARNVAGLLLMFGLSLYFAYQVLRPDAGRARDAGGDDPGRRTWQGRWVPSGRLPPGRYSMPAVRW